MAADLAAAEPSPARAGGAGGAGSGRDANPAAIPSFIETQLPVSRLSKESYKERKANYSQTLTGLGKWWGRKPPVMVRAVILGLLMPASADPRKDREVFLALLTMDEDGLRRRKTRSLPLREIWRRLAPSERAEWFAEGSGPERPKLRKGTNAAARERLQRLVFDRLSYDEKLKWCDRPEQIDGPSPEAWQAINAHLGTRAASLPALVRELGERRFGRVPRIGDAFCGGGSIPFEAARLGCEAFGSDLNPVAALLTWGALHIVGGGEAVAARIREAQGRVFEDVDHQVTAWRIEHNPAGWRADAFLYCAETRCPECGWRVPLAPSWVIGEKTRAVAQLVPVAGERRFRIDIHSGVDRAALAAARAAGTVKQSRLECPHCHASTPMAAIRGDRRGAGGRPEGSGERGYGLRRWENEDLDIARQLAREPRAGEPDPIEAIIEGAVRAASNFLVPAGLPAHLWRRLGPEEKLYLKGLEVESHGDFRAGVYQEFARGFGVRDYRGLLRTGKANETRLKTASELRRQDLGGASFGASLVRHALYAVWQAAESEDVSDSLTWLRTELPDYWARREALTPILRYLAALPMEQWRPDATAARLLAGAVENDHV